VGVGAKGQIWVLSEAVDTVMWCSVTCHPALKGRVLLGLMWKLNLILKQLEGKAKGPGVTRWGEAAQGGFMFPGDGECGGDAKPGVSGWRQPRQRPAGCPATRCPVEPGA